MEDNIIDKLNKKINKTNTKVKFLKNKIATNKEYKRKFKNNARKERVHKLISKGVLFEIIDLMDEDNEILLGFLSYFKKLKKEEKEKCKSIGKEIFEEKKKRKDGEI